MGPEMAGVIAKLQVLSFRDTSRFIEYRLIAEYDIVHDRKSFSSQRWLKEGENGTKKGALTGALTTSN
jgi:hypothetical protein